ncbi:MAG: MATE family efflux transporter [Flavobacteriia bacterium]|nr:MATE family efflux transporter [Flavobacteriia bacterium]
MLNYSYKTILSVAVPLMVSSFIQSIVMITDSSFLSRYSTLAFDASGNAGLLYVSVFVALLGMSDAVQILIARRIGEKNKIEVASIFFNSILTIGFLASVLFLVLHLIMPSVLPLYAKHEDITLAQIEFLSVRSYALFFTLISLPIQAFFFAIGKTWVVLISALIIAVTNIFLDYYLIFGISIFPEMGIKGAALASCIADGMGMLFLFTFLLFSRERKEFELFKQISFNYNKIIQILNIGFPLFFQGFIALATWTIFFTWIEQIGKFELTVSQTIRSIYMLAFVPIWGFSATTKTYISQYLGAKKFSELIIIQRRIQFLCLFFLFLFFHGAIFYPEKLVTLINPNHEFTEKSVAILQFICGSILIFGFVAIKFHTINGSGNTKVTFFIELISVSIYLTCCYLFIKVFQWDIFWIWSVEYIYFLSLGLFSLSYLRFFDWKKKKV